MKVVTQGTPVNETANLKSSGFAAHAPITSSALTQYQRLYVCPDENGTEMVQFWNDSRLFSLSYPSTQYGVYISELTIEWSEEVKTSTPPAAPVIATDMLKNNVLANGATLTYVNKYVAADGYTENIFINSGDDDTEDTKLYYTWRDDEVTIDNYLNVTTEYYATGAHSNGLPVDPDGTTLRVFAVRDGFISDPVTVNFNKITAASFSSLADLMKAENDGQLVVLDTPLRTRGWLTGANAKVGSAFYSLFTYDPTCGAALKIHYFDNKYSPAAPHANNPLRISDYNPIASWAEDYELNRTGSETKASPHRYFTTPGSITGIYRHNGGAAPTIEISSNTPGSPDYHTLLGKKVGFTYSAYGDGCPNPAPSGFKTLVKAVETVDYLTEADFNHQRGLRSALYRNFMFELTDADGAVQRVKIDDTYPAAPHFDASALTAGERYYVEGFIGASGVNYSIYPIAVAKCPAMPVLLAPNKIDSDEINMISSSFRITVDPDGVDPATIFTYTIDGLTAGSQTANGTLSLDDAADRSKGILIDGARFKDSSITLSVTATLGNVSAEPVTITINRHAADEYATIADFKKAYLGSEADLPEVGSAMTGDNVHYSQLTGTAVIVKKTPEYLYVRDNLGDSHSYTSENYLLVHNSNGWVNPIINDGTTERELSEGDIITGAALIPAVSKLKNLVSETTGFARTVRYADESVEPATLEPEVIIVDNTNSASADYYTNPSKAFDDSSDRMRYYTLKTVQVLRRANPEAATDPTASKWIYKLMLGSDKEEEWPELTLNIFTVRDGWAAAFGDDAATDGLVFPFEITGVAMRNGAAGKMALALTEFKGSEAPEAPAVTLKGVDDNGGSATVKYVYTGTIDLSPADPQDQIWYTTDGSDALQNPGRKLFTGDYSGTNSDLNLVGAREQVIVSAFSIRPGSSPSPATVRVFERQAIEREFIANILKGSAGDWYHFNGDVCVVAVGPEYMFVRGVLGQYLPVYSAGGFEGLAEGDYLTDFIVRHAVDKGNIQVNTTAETVFTPANAPVGDTRIDIGSSIAVNSISKANLRQKVTLRRAVVSGSGSSWTIKGQDDQAQERRLNVGMAGPMTGDELVSDGVFDITGFVMYGSDGALELWPVSAAAVATSGAVSAIFSAGTEISNSGSDINARFYPMTLVTLKTADANVTDATIYYAIYDENITAESAVVWSPYVRPISIVEPGRLHAYSVEPGKEPGEHLHINFTRSEMSGDVAFDVTETDGKMTVTLTAPGAPEGTEIHYSIGSFAEEDFATYTAPITVDKTAIVYARIKEPGKIAGAVSHVLVVVPEATAPDPAKVSGKVKFTVTENEDGSAMIVNMELDGDMTGTIYYLINPTVAVTPENGLVFTEPFPMTEGGRIMAILVESGKLPGEPTDVTVWLIPTDIDGVDADRTESEVRAEGSGIIAPAGSEVYDITGRRVNPTGLRSGIYIVRTPGGKSVKIRI